ncbi:MAG: hypothetical protein AAGC47_00370 [Bacteroidota bacterium]
MPRFDIVKTCFFTITLLFLFDSSVAQIGIDQSPRDQTVKKYPFVYRESHHQMIYEDSLMRVLDVFASNGDTTLFHQHCNPILYITIHGEEVGLLEPNGKWKHVPLPTDWIGHNIYSGDSCFVHKFTVSGETYLQILAVEAKRQFEPVKGLGNPKYDEDFVVYDWSNSDEIEKVNLDSPVLLVEKNCEGKCQVSVTSSLENVVLENFKVYSVGFKKMP